MKSFRSLIVALVAVSFVSAAAFAADAAASVAGTWKWTAAGRGGNPGMEQTVKLELKDGKLSGTAVGFEGPQGKIPDVAIEDASFKDGVVAFSISREFNGQKRVAKYSGKLEGDSIKGSSERAGRDGQVQKTDWAATRAK